MPLCFVHTTILSPPKPDLSLVQVQLTPQVTVEGEEPTASKYLASEGEYLYLATEGEGPGGSHPA